MKTNYKIYTFVVALALTLPSCLDLVPENALTYTNAFETPEEMEAVVSTLQSTAAGVIANVTAQEKLGEIYNGVNKNEGGDPTRIIAHNWTPSLMGGAVHLWNGQYSMIGLANIVESNVRDTYPTDKKNFLLGQAAFFKAYAYYDLARAYGWAPIVPDNDSDAPAVPCSTEDELLAKATEYALKAFDYCARSADLYHTDGVKVTNKQYASKEIVAALLAHINAWRGSATLGLSDADRQKYWQESEKYSSMLIDGEFQGYATLEPTIADLQEKTLNSRHGRESIFEIELDPKYIKTMPGNAFYTAKDFFTYPYLHGSTEQRTSLYTVSCKLINDLYGEAGTPDERKLAYFPENDKLYDPKYDAEATKPDEKIESKKVPFGPGGMWTMDVLTGGFPMIAPNRTYVRKFHKQFIYSDSPDRPEAFVNFDTNRVVWRLADIILLRAEVRNFLGKTADAIRDLNTIRARAKAVLFPAPTDTEDLQYAIFHERERELIYENSRWWDIRRNQGYYKRFLPYAFRVLSQQDIVDGALGYMTPEDAGKYNVNMIPNKYWFSREN